MQEEQDKSIERSKEQLQEELEAFRRLYEDSVCKQQAEKIHLQLNETRLSSLVHLSQMNDRDYKEVMDFGLEEAIRLTDSKIGYIFFYNESTGLFTLYSWSKNVMEQCSVVEKQTLYELDKTGLWGEAVRQRRAIITNDYSAPNPYKKGYPEGHVALKRHMNLPIFRNGKIVAVIGVANKEEDYTEMDVQQLQLFMDGLWNIVERKQFEDMLIKNEEMFRTVSEFAYDWEYWISPTGLILYCSPSCQKISGYSPEEFIKNPRLLYSITHPEDKALLPESIEESHGISSEAHEMEYRIVTKDGQVRWIGHACKPVFNEKGEFMGRRVSNRDITERKSKEQEVVESRQKIQKLNSNIIKMLKIMSHDIRGPLIAVSSTLKLLLRGTYGPMDDNVYQTVKDLNVRVNQIIGLAEECLAKAQMVDDDIHIEKTEIDLRHEVIESVLAELAGQIEEKNIFIDNRLGAIPTGTITVNASKVWLKVVYRNLFSNAIKYGGKGCTIAFGYEDHGSFYRFNVYNTGAPIPEDKRDILFTKFGRIQREGDDIKEGLGMGLFMTKEIITQHGGSIWYEAKPEGNDFVFTLPK